MAADIQGSLDTGGSNTAEGLAVLVISLIVYQYWCHGVGVPSEHTAIVGCQPLPPTLNAPIKHFVGRDAEMKEAIESLQSFRIVNIVGPPGFGKSALAISVGHQLKDNGHNIVYIDMSYVIDPHSVKQWILYGTANITTANNDTMVDLKIRKWASGLKCPTVIILDGCDAMFYENKDELYRLIKTLVESSSNISVLTTGRHSLVQSNAHGIALQELSLQSAITLLGKLHPQLNDTQKRLLANVTGNAPLALVAIGALLNRVHGPTPDEVISDLQDRQKFLRTPDMDPELQVDSCIQYSYKFLDSQSQILSQYLANFPASFTADAACCIATGNCELTAIQTREGNETRGLLSNLTQNDCREKLNDLVTRSLLEPPDKSTQRYKLHKLIQKFLCARLTEEVVSIYKSRFVEYYSKLHLVDLSIQALLSEKANILHAFDILHSCCSVDDQVVYAKKAHQVLFLVAENVDLSLLRTSLHQCSMKDYATCATTLDSVFQHNSASSPVVQVTVVSYLFSLFSSFTHNELVLGVMMQEGIRVYPMVIQMPNSELLDTQLFNEILIPLYQFYLELGRQEWAYSVIEKNIEIWTASDLTMSEPMRNIVNSFVVEHLKTGNYDEAKKMIDANIENTRRTLRKMEDRRNVRLLIPDDVVDAAVKNSTNRISDLEHMIFYFLGHAVFHDVGKLDVICVFDQSTAGSLCDLMDAAINEWENLPHQQLMEIMNHKFYTSLEGVMKRCKNIRARVHFCINVSGIITPTNCSILPTNRASKSPSRLLNEYWIGIDQEVALVQRINNVTVPSHIGQIYKNTQFMFIQFDIGVQVLMGLVDLLSNVMIQHETDQEVITATFWEEMKSIMEELANDVLMPIMEFQFKGEKYKYLQAKVDVIELSSGTAEKERIRCIWEREIFESKCKTIDDLLPVLELLGGPFASNLLESVMSFRSELSFCAVSNGVLAVTNGIDPHKELQLAYYKVTRRTELFTWQIYMFILNGVKLDLETLPITLVQRGTVSEVNFRLGQEEMQILCAWNTETAEHLYKAFYHISVLLDSVNDMVMALNFGLDVWSTLAAEKDHLYAELETIRKGVYFCKKAFGFLIFSDYIDPPKAVMLSETELHSHVNAYTNNVTVNNFVFETSELVRIRQAQEVIPCKCLWGEETVKPEAVDQNLTLLIEMLNFIIDLVSIARSSGSEELRSVVNDIEVFQEAGAHLIKFLELQKHLYLCVNVSVTEILPADIPLVPEVASLKSALSHYMQILTALHLLPFSQLMQISSLNYFLYSQEYLCVWDQETYEHTQELLEDGTSVLNYLYQNVRNDLLTQHREYFQLIRSKLYFCHLS